MAAPAAVAVKVAAKALRHRRARQRTVNLVVGGFTGLAVALLVVAAVIDGTDSVRPVGSAAASAFALDDIPGPFLELYQQAGARWGVDWAILGGIGKVECDHGRSQATGCPQGTANRCGARGPMQFLGNTWRQGTDPVPAGSCPGSAAFTGDPTGAPIPAGEEARGYATDANADAIADPWEPADAIHAAARMLTLNGAPGDIDAALRAYNNSDEYVTRVLDYAERYKTPAGTGGELAYDGSPGNVPTSDITCPGGGTTTVHAQLAPAVTALYADAAAAGHHLCGGGYRSPERQVELRRQNCGTSDYAIYEMPSSQCEPPTARPGSSMHELGLAIDLTCDGSLIRTTSNDCYRWLTETVPAPSGDQPRASAYGLFPLDSEPWHFSVNGR
jgi:hypothetical protein